MKIEDNKIGADKNHVEEKKPMLGMLPFDSYEMDLIEFLKGRWSGNDITLGYIQTEKIKFCDGGDMILKCGDPKYNCNNIPPSSDD